MDVERVFTAFAGIWGVGTIGTLIYTIRLCYEIERRSGWRKPGDLPTYAAWIPVLVGKGVAQDEETQALRRRMIRLCLLILAGGVLFAIVVSFVAKP